MSFLIWIGALTVLAVAAAPFFPEPRRITDTLSHFALQGAVAAIALLIIAVFSRAGGQALYLCLLLSYGLGLFHIWPYFKTRRPKKDPNAQTLKILQANVLVRNTNAFALETLIRTEKPDIVLLMEVNDAFAQLCNDLSADYPHHHVIANDTTSFGIAVLSVLPLHDLETKHLAEAHIPSLFFKIQKNEKTFHVVALHAENPLRRIDWRDREFKELATWHEKEMPQHLIVGGDFNATPWCPALKKLARSTGLKNARKGFGLHGTFPAHMPLNLLRLPIDHVLTSPETDVLEFRAVKLRGSDHRSTITIIKL